jgi:hypothetical protein
MPEPIPLRFNDVSLLRKLREVAQDSGQVFFTPHAKARMKQRRITRPQVLACLRQGSIDEPAHQNIRGNWQCTVRHVHAGDLVRVAAVLERDENGDLIAVITVF